MEASLKRLVWLARSRTSATPPQFQSGRETLSQSSRSQTHSRLEPRLKRCSPSLGLQPLQTRAACSIWQMTNYQRKHFRETQEPHGKQSEEEEEEEGRKNSTRTSLCLWSDVTLTHSQNTETKREVNGCQERMRGHVESLLSLSPLSLSLSLSLSSSLSLSLSLSLSNLIPSPHEYEAWWN